MLAQVTTLRHWKSEHTAETCEDAVGVNSACGLFAVADGAGTTLFSATWADLLVRHFLAVPLLDADPFEAEWWVRLAQQQFKHDLPAQADLTWNAQQKVQSQGSYSTLATLRFSRQDANHATAELLAIGDSCIFIHHPGQILSFPLQHAAEFEQAPICIPSKPGAFYRYFHQFQTMTFELTPADVVVLATDAVAKWIVSAGNGGYGSQGEALQEIVSQTEQTWPAFIQARRARQEMLDDDCTALVIALQPGDATTDPRLDTIKTTTEHSQPIRAQRTQDFQQALADENKERAAIYYGSGADLRAQGVTVSPQEFAQAREVADALSEVLSRLRQVVNKPDMIPVMTTVWQKHAGLLDREPCAATVRKTLARLGVPVETHLPVEPDADITAMETLLLPLPPTHATTTDDTASKDDEMLMTQTFELQERRHDIEANRLAREE